MKLLARQRPLFLGLGAAIAAWGIGRLLGPRPLRRDISALPASISDVTSKHVSREDFRDFDAAVREHVNAGKPLTKAAIQMLAAIYFTPEEVDAIKNELRTKGIL